ncbi:ABC transporter permease [Psychrobacillus psychrodurans]|uniref:ABC transporter permease n=1 Tax=Psychrobacillus psychrodurans TaxID=126157 RepID=UPI0008E4E94A|nr:ABC transporter permease [Psychrobacillus psychrodurans]MCZ8539064.1 ABC transporter permease [Psychrobacillus psychrodurans]SFM27736.1 putative ABC transport system permease protein [Psychrobacillus psychrodurans]
MKLFTAFKLACFGLWSNRYRVLSAMTGVVIGMFAVIVLTAIAIGVKDTLMKQMGSLGAEQILVMPGRVLDTANGQKDILSGLTSVPSTLTYEDALALKDVPNVKTVTPQLETVNFVNYGDKTIQSAIVGTTDQYSRVQHAKLAEGRFFTKEEQFAEAKVVVVGNNIHDSLLGKNGVPEPEVNGSADVEETKTWWKRILDKLLGDNVSAQENSLVGQMITINKESFEVIGVLAPNATLGSSTDNNVVMPIETALVTTEMKNLTKMIVETSSLEVVDEVDGAVFNSLAANHSEIDFSVVKQDQMLGALGKVTSILQVMLVGITVTALFISGTGIMNVMVMSVRERTREIGIRKALGATTFEIMMQFFFETLLLCIIGGAIGIGLGYAIIEVWNSNIEIFALVLPMWAVKLALYTSVAIGSLVGIYPALKAASMKPSKALRFE